MTWSPYKSPECTRPGCGHVDSSHHEGRHACTAMYCDCARYRKPGAPASVPPPAALPKVEKTLAWDLDSIFDTYPTDPDTWPSADPGD